jgi:hypothetical protein
MFWAREIQRGRCASKRDASLEGNCIDRVAVHEYARISSGRVMHYFRQKRKLTCGPGRCLVVAAASRPWSMVAAVPRAEPGGGEAEGRRKVWHPGLLDRIARCAGWHASVARSTGLSLVRPSSRPVRVPLAGLGAVQQESTATHTDRGGRAGRVRTVTCGDGRGWTCCRQMACKRPGVRVPLAPHFRRSRWCCDLPK